MVSNMGCESDDPRLIPNVYLSILVASYKLITGNELKKNE